jgi:hypothetical protein
LNAVLCNQRAMHLIAACPACEGGVSLCQHSECECPIILRHFRVPFWRAPPPQGRGCQVLAQHLACWAKHITQLLHGFFSFILRVAFASECECPIILRHSIAPFWEASPPQGRGGQVLARPIGVGRNQCRTYSQLLHRLLFFHPSCRVCERMPHHSEAF